MVVDEINTDIEFIKNHTLQPKWWKKLKVFVLLGMILSIYWMFGLSKTILWFSIVITLGFIVHMTYRTKTQVYTKSWMDFHVKEVNGELVYGRIGLRYYFLVILIFTIATVTIILL